MTMLTIKSRNKNATYTFRACENNPHYSDIQVFVTYHTASSTGGPMKGGWTEKRVYQTGDMTGPDGFQKAARKIYRNSTKAWSKA